MAIELSTKAKLLSSQTNIQSQIVVEIDGFDLIFGAIDVTKLVRIGDFIIGDGTLIGGTIVDPRNRAYITIGGGSKTTKSISQQLQQDKGGTGSVSSVKIEMIDKKGELTKIFSPGDTVDDILSRKAKVYMAFKGGAHPEDSIIVFSGLIDAISFGAGNCLINIAHPEQLKRQELFQLIQVQTTSTINPGDTTISVTTAVGIINGSDALTSFVRINDEIIGFSGTTGTTLTGCTRGQFNTIDATHALGDDLETNYRLQGGMKDLALKIMLSGGDEYFSTQDCSAFEQLTAVINLPNSVSFIDGNIESTLGLVVGDTVLISGATEGANNGAFTIRSFGVISTGSYIVLNSANLVIETDTLATCQFKSKYNTLPEGCGMTPEQVDVAQHEDINDLFVTSFADYDFLLKDTIKAEEFINTQLYFPSGAYQIPRKGKSSLGITTPPLALTETKILSSSNVKKPDKLNIGRSIGKNFYNAVVYKYNPDRVGDKFLDGTITQSSRSTNRIKTGNRSLKLEAQGLRRGAEVSNMINIQSRRLLDRFQFGSESIQTEVQFSVGVNLEVGDTVIFEGASLKISDSQSGTRDFKPRIMEITNKQLNVTTGVIKLDLLDTAFELDARYITFAPSSIIGIGSTTTDLVLTRSYSTDELQDEKEKWEPYIGQQILVRSEDWSFQELTEILSFDIALPNLMRVNPPITAPPSGYIIDLPNYDNTSDVTNALQKRVHGAWCPQVLITSGASGAVFDVGASDVSKFRVGSFVRVHNTNYSNDGDSEVTDITSNTITIKDDLGFTPSLNDEIDLIGFQDGGLNYRWL